MVYASLQTLAVALGAAGELPDLHRTRQREGSKTRRQSTMHNAARSSRTKAGWWEPQQRQACPAAGWSWQARWAELEAG